MRKLFKKKEIFKVKSLPVDPTSMGEPSTVEEYVKRGVAYYARHQLKEAEADLKKAVSMDGNNIDSYYSLGMVLKAMDRKDDAVKAFKQAIECIRTRPDATEIKYDMLRRLAVGHIHELTEGDWNLEDEIWKRM